MVDLQKGGKSTPLSNYKFIVAWELARPLTKADLRVIVRCRRKDFSFAATLAVIDEEGGTA